MFHITKMFSSINVRLLPIKAHYFLFNLGTGPIVANLAIIARQRGFSSAIVGLLLTVLYVVATISKPLFGWVADRFQKHVIIFIIMQGITALTFFAVYFVPPIPHALEVNYASNSTEVYFCPRDPEWDKCLYGRIEQSRGKTIKCQLNCRPELWMVENVCSMREDYDPDCISNLMKPYRSEIMLDIDTIANDSDCMIVREKSAAHENGSSFVSAAPAYFRSYEVNCDAVCEEEFFKTTLINRGTIPDDEIVMKYQFWLFCGLLLIGYATNSVVISMADTICFDMLGSNSHQYGRQRMWDAIGWGVAALFLGFVIDAISGDAVIKDYTVVFFFCLVTICVNMLCSTKLTYSQPKESKSILKDVGKIFKSWKIFTFFCWCCFCGFFSAVVWNFIFWHLEDLTEKIGQNECGVNSVKTLEGIDLFLQCFGEIPFFFYAGFFLKKFGPVNCMHIVMGIFAIRFYYLSALVNPWWALPIEGINGVTYGLMYSTMTSYVNTIAPPGTEATMQGFVGGLFEGVGISLGNFSAGTLFKMVGGNSAFLIFGITATTCLVVHFLAHKLFAICERRDKKKVAHITAPQTNGAVS